MIVKDKQKSSDCDYRLTERHQMGRDTAPE